MMVLVFGLIVIQINVFLVTNQFNIVNTVLLEISA